LLGDDDRGDEIEQDHRHERGEQGDHDGQQPDGGRFGPEILGDAAADPGEDAVRPRAIQPTLEWLRR
jgi:hypothetical protein